MRGFCAWPASEATCAEGVAASLSHPTSTMPSWLQAFVDVNPVTILSDATRGLMRGGAVAGPVAGSLLWAAVIVAIFAPLSVWAFKRRV